MNMNGFIVYDNIGHCPMTDAHGHFKVYAKKASAVRQARDNNNCVFPKLVRYSVIEFVGFAGPSTWEPKR
jgi:hypothetical protein